MNHKFPDVIARERGPTHDLNGFDIEHYENDIAEFDLTEEEAEAYLQALWLIMRSFVDLAFGLDSTQHDGAAESCGQVSLEPQNSLPPCAYPPAPVLESASENNRTREEKEHG